MAVATISGVEKAYAGRSVLRGIDLEIQAGQRIGLVGPNGAGKTTLLKILAGEEHADHGSVHIARNVKWSYVSQQPRLDPDETLRHQITLVFDDLRETERQMHEAADLLSVHPSGPEHDAAMERYGHLEEHFQHMGGYEMERRVEIVVDQLGFTQRDLDLPIKALSGGQKCRAQLARLLLEAPDLMLLDEPTNHLDLPMLDWLEKHLLEMAGITIVVVSHDRYFLDSITTEIVEMQGGQVERYPGNYSNYTTLRAERMLTRQRAFEQQQSYISKQEEYIRRFLAGQRAAQAQGRKMRLDRLKQDSLVVRPKVSEKSMILNLEVQKPSGLEVLRVEELTKSFGEKKLFADLDLKVLRGLRLGVIGANGTGKTTLLNILAGQMEADAGKFKWGHGVAMQYYHQEHQDLVPDNNIMQELQRAKITCTQQEMRDLAGLFLFSGDTIFKPVKVLSGGEKARVSIARLLLQPTNTILMDEPTNHLDMNTCEILETALESYDGTLILVSHDRYFMDQVCDQLLILGRTPEGEPTSRLFNGSYTDYLAAVAKEKQAVVEARRQQEKAERKALQEKQEKPRKSDKKSAAPDAKSPRKEAGAKAKIPFKYSKMTLGQVETRIIELEKEILHTENSFGSPTLASNATAMLKAQQSYEQLKSELAEVNAVWELKAAE